MHIVCKRYYIETATRPHAITQNNIMLCHPPVSITSFKLYLQRLPFKTSYQVYMVQLINIELLKYIVT